MPSLEVACFTPSSALHALHAGARRIELCGGTPLNGGTTPALATLSSARERAPGIPLNVMLRPRAGDFVYSAAEFQAMKDDMVRVKELGLADGFVFGILDGSGRVDVRRCSELVRVAGDRPCTFHRAFDQIEGEDREGALEDVVRCGFRTLLTSGGAADAVKGWERCKELVERAGARIEIMPRGGVRSGNLEVLRGTGAEWYHSSGIVEGGDRIEGDRDEIRRMVEVLKDG